MKVLILGGGLAGISAAIHLSKNDIQSTIIEASSKLGGRTYSFEVPEYKDIIDNGQHILMGCYSHTLDYLEITGTLNKLYMQNKLKVILIDKSRQEYHLQAKSNLYPFNLLNAVLNFGAISFRERIEVIKFFGKLYFKNKDDLAGMTVDEWLRSWNQSESTIKSLWDILVVGTLNTSIESASAKTFAKVLREIFFNGNKASTILIPKTGLSQLFCDGAEKYLIDNGSNINFSERVKSLKIDDGSVSDVITNKNSYRDFDYVVSALPPNVLRKIDEENQIFNNRFPEFSYSTIMTIHIWLKINPFKERFYGLIDSPVHWVFNHQKHISLTVSNANRFNNLSKEETMDIALEELESYFQFFQKEQVQDYKIIKEKRATIVQDPDTESLREKISSNLQNILIAGDWTNTGLPATIEGAIKSGKDAAGQILFE